jgi:hypothetical protein
VQLPDARHGHAGCRGAGFHPQLDENALQVFFDRHGAGAQNVANVLVGLALDHPVQHLGLAAVSLKHRPMASTTAVSDTSRITISQSPAWHRCRRFAGAAEGQALGTALQAQLGRLAFLRQHTQAIGAARPSTGSGVCGAWVPQ